VIDQRDQDRGLGYEKESESKSMGQLLDINRGLAPRSNNRTRGYDTSIGDGESEEGDDEIDDEDEIDDDDDDDEDDDYDDGIPDGLSGTAHDMAGAEVPLPRHMQDWLNATMTMSKTMGGDKQEQHATGAMTSPVRREEADTDGGRRSSEGEGIAGRVDHDHQSHNVGGAVRGNHLSGNLSGSGEVYQVHMIPGAINKGIDGMSPVFHRRSLVSPAAASHHHGSQESTQQQQQQQQQGDHVHLALA